MVATEELILWAANYGLLLGILFGVVRLSQAKAAPGRFSLFGRRRRR